MTNHRHATLCIGIFGVLLFAILVVNAQERVITQDEVNAVAEQMYCPVCENIPLDDCGTPTCVQWKEEIRILLSEGKSAAQIVDDFVLRYGEQVVGIPQSMALQGLAFIVPVIGIGLAILIGTATFTRWRQHPPTPPAPDDIAAIAPADATTDDYRTRLERDLL